VVFLALGVVLYLVLIRFTRNLGRQIEEAQKG